MSTEIDKHINTSFAVRTVKNVIHMYATLSDRLKQAGIKENKPKSPGKGCKHKNAKRKKKNQKGYSKAYMSSSFQRTKKFRKPLKHFVTPYTDKSVQKPPQNDPPQAETPSKHSQPAQENAPETEENAEKETIFVSLDFIEDCQNYKKKVRKQNTHRSVASCKKQSLDERRSSGKSIESVEKGEANAWDDGESGDQQEENSNENEKQMSPAEKRLSEVLQCVQPLLNQLSSDNIAKIDKKYLDSILSFATKLEAKKKELVDESDNKPAETHAETRKKLTGRDFFELKLKTKECQEELLRKDNNNNNNSSSSCSSNSSSAIEDEQTECKDGFDSTRTDARIVRDMTKSEEQIKLKKGKNVFDNCNNSKMKTKNVTHSKPDINGMSRKTRKPRNKLMKNNAKEFIETSLPSEMSKAADVKELWRRRTLLKKSENSLTSHSSCTVPESDEYPASKNLESYKFLKKLVEDEIANISKKPENKNNTGEVKTKENNPGIPKQSELTKKPPPCRRTNELPILKRRLLQAEGKIEKPELLNLLGEDVPEEANPKLGSPEEKAKNGKIPSKIIENWSILNRLEQAFLGLGTPTFPDKNTKSNPKSKHPNGNERTHTPADKLLKETKKVQKYREVLRKENKGSAVQKNAPKTDKKTESGIKANASKEGAPVRPKKSGKRESSSPPHPQERHTPKAEESNSTQKKKLSDRSLRSKPSITPNTRRGGREEHVTPSQAGLSIKSKHQKTTKKVVASAKKVSAENLERKKTFDVIPETDESTVRPRRSKSCVMKDISLEGRFSQTRMQDSKVFSKGGQKVRSRSIENDAKMTTVVHKRLAKNPIKGATTCEEPSKLSRNIKSVGEKECSKGSREKTPRSRSNQEKVVKNFRVTEELPKDLWPVSNMCGTEKDKKNNYDNKKSIENQESNNAAKERPVKKRSILSVHANQHCEQATRKLQQIQEKEASVNSLENVYRTSEKEFKSSHSNTSITSTATVQLVDVNSENRGNEGAGLARKMEISQRSTTSVIKNYTSEGKNEEGEKQGEWRTRKKRLWEQDMTHYRSIVREIMSQYKRIDGFLKQNEHLRSFTNDLTSLSVLSNDSNKSENDSQLVNIHEYRKKIIMEYKELPIFEYKSKMEQNKEGSFSDSVRNRNLLVVRDYYANPDDDVKDYQPKIQTVLDSQLYVDTERLVRRNETRQKFSDKIASLQDMVLRGNGGKIIGEEWQRSSSTPKAFQPQDTQVILPNVQRPASQNHGIDNVTSDSTTCYGLDTES